MNKQIDDIKNWIEKLNADVEQLSLFDTIKFVCENKELKERLEGETVFSTSFGIEDQMLTHILSVHNFSGTVFTIDTGRLFTETFDVFDSTQNKYKNLKIKTYFPDEEEIQNYVLEYGINGFYQTIENRKKCCYIRKVIPLNRALKNASLWITGLRAEQSNDRQNTLFFEWDDIHQLIKFNPLLKYSLKEVEEFVKQHKVPVNSLYAQGFVSIGCAPCTRAILPNEDFRAGRWWWEIGSKKECGLHVK